MPWSKVSEAPKNVRKLDGVSLTLDQMNWVAKVADAIGGEFAWPTAINKFKKSYAIKDGTWKKRDVSEKEYSDDIIVEKQNNGKYRIVTVSTAALADREGETFTVKAIDYEIAQAKKTGEYPEIRVFHKRPLGIGRVKSMRRVGIFAVDEGESYDDPFSLEVCEKMLANNDGTWKVSRGFKVLEASGNCPNCGESLLVREKHMVAGFRCPTCGETNLGFKGSFDKTRFLKTKTFDITVTDVPAVPWTGVSAFLPSNTDQEVVMTKKELKTKLLKAGLSEEAIEARLSTVSDEQLKSFDELPFAQVLKEFDEDDADDSVDEEDDGNQTEKEKKVPASAESEQTFVLDPSVLKEFGKIAADEAKKALEGATLEATEATVDKDSPVIVKLEELVALFKEMQEKVDILMEKDEDRLKELYSDAPRGSKLRISRFKAAEKSTKPVKGKDDDEEVEEEDTSEHKEFGKVIGADGTVSESMTAFLRETKTP
jgi:hypothetical protein